MTAIRMAAELNVESTEAIKKRACIFQSFKMEDGNTGPSPVFVSLKASFCSFCGRQEVWPRGEYPKSCREY